MNYSFLLSAIQSDQQKKTLVQVQMLHKKLFTTERMVIAENKLESFKEIVEYIFETGISNIQDQYSLFFTDRGVLLGSKDCLCL